MCAARPLSDVGAPDAVLEVTAAVLGRDRLREALREQHGLTYAADAAVLKRRRARALILCTRLPTADTTRGLGVLLVAIKGLKASPPTAAEVERARAVLASQLTGERDDVAATMESWTRALELGTPTSLAEQRAALERVTAEDVARVAASVAGVDTLQLVLSGERAVVEAAVKAHALGKASTVNVARE